jgi:beta-apo-4'-carotenal oxygenase
MLRTLTATVVNETTSGGLTINDGWFHGQLMNAPFGGVGTSGSGNYRGRFSFEAFTHRRTVAEVPNWVEKLLRVRYMPYDWRELARLRRLSGAKPNFDRDGRIVKGLGYWVGFVLSLGGSGAKGALLRWFVLFAVGVAASYGGLLKKRSAL